VPDAKTMRRGWECTESIFGVGSRKTHWKSGRTILSGAGIYHTRHCPASHSIYFILCESVSNPEWIAKIAGGVITPGSWYMSCSLTKKICQTLKQYAKAWTECLNGICCVTPTFEETDPVLMWKKSTSGLVNCNAVNNRRLCSQKAFINKKKIS
jgi:hypothetical protein